MNSEEEVKKMFAYKHLPTHLQRVSFSFHDLALHIYRELEPSAERTLCLHKLWEAKNYAVWCAANP